MARVWHEPYTWHESVQLKPLNEEPQSPFSFYHQKVNYRFRLELCHLKSVPNLEETLTYMTGLKQTNSSRTGATPSPMKYNYHLHRRDHKIKKIEINFKQSELMPSTSIQPPRYTVPLKIYLQSLWPSALPYGRIQLTKHPSKKPEPNHARISESGSRSET